MRTDPGKTRGLENGAEGTKSEHLHLLHLYEVWGIAAAKRGRGVSDVNLLTRLFMGVKGVKS